MPPLDASERRAGEFVRSEAGANPLALIEKVTTWKSQFQEKGWASD
jgi:hypothetical protein